MNLDFLESGKESRWGKSERLMHALLLLLSLHSCRLLMTDRPTSTSSPSPAFWRNFSLLFGVSVFTVEASVFTAAALLAGKWERTRCKALRFATAERASTGLVTVGGWGSSAGAATVGGGGSVGAATVGGGDSEDPASVGGEGSEEAASVGGEGSEEAASVGGEGSEEAALVGGEGSEVATSVGGEGSEVAGMVGGGVSGFAGVATTFFSAYFLRRFVLIAVRFCEDMAAERFR